MIDVFMTMIHALITVIGAAHRGYLASLLPIHPIK